MATTEVLRYKVVVDNKDSLKKVGALKTGVGNFTKSAGAGFASMSAALNPAILGFAAAAASVVAIGKGIKASVVAFKDFEKEMANVSTLVDTNVVDMENLKNQIMGLSPELGKATELTAALYQAISGGVEAGKAVQFVADSALAAKAGLSSAFTAVDAGTTMMNSFGMAAEDASLIYDQMFVAVKAGKTTFEQLASSIGKVAPLASEAGLSTEELLAAVAALTTTGQKTSETITSLKAALSNIIKPGKAAWEAADAMGLKWDAATLKAKGLTKFMDDLAEATGGDTGKMAELFGSTEALNSMLFLTGKGADKFKDILGDMGNASGEADKAFDKQTETMEHSIDTMNASINKLAITFGEVLAPAIKPIIDTITSFVKGLTNAILWIQKAVKWTKSIKLEFAGFEVSLADFLVPFHGYITAVKNLVNLFKLMGEWGGKAFDKITEIEFGDIFAGITEPFKQMADAMRDMIKWLKDKLSWGETEAEQQEKLQKMTKKIAGNRTVEKEELQKIVALVEKYGRLSDDRETKAAAETEGFTASGEAAVAAVEKTVAELDALLKEKGFNIEIDVDTIGGLDAKDTLKSIKKLIEEMDEMGVTVVFQGEGSTVKPLTEKTSEMTKLLKKFEDDVDNSTPTLKMAFEDIAGNSLSTAMSTLETELNGMFDSIIEGTFDLEQSFDDMIRNILKAIAKMLASQAIASWVTLLGGSIAGMFAGGGAGPTHMGAGGTTAYGMAAGGPVTQNKPYMIGEKGPELFVPNRSGSIVPNDKLGGGGGGGTLSIVNNISVEGSGDAQQDQRFSRDIARAMDEKIKMQIANQMRPGGVLNSSKAVAGR